MKPTMIIGGPGTGKTHALVDTILKEKPEKFALVSFTRRAANEAKQRLRPYYADSDLRYVRTIHSLCFELLGLRKTQVLTFQHLREFGDQYGYMFTHRNRSQEDDQFYEMTDDDVEYRQMMINRVRLKKTDAYESGMWRSYLQFKVENHLIDFNDMLYGTLNIPNKRVTFDLLCIDEVQDLSPLQLQVVRYLADQSNLTVYAGDPDQMIFEWAGVDRGQFFKLLDSCTLKVLTENHRGKPEKEYIGYLPDMRQDESHLILARNNYLLRSLLLYSGEFQRPWQWLSSDDAGRGVIRLSTIHGAKGSEADNVIIFPDVSPATYEHLDTDIEKRVWHVGLTRAKKKIYIIEPQTEMFYDLS